MRKLASPRICINIMTHPRQPALCFLRSLLGLGDTRANNNTAISTSVGPRLSLDKPEYMRVDGKWVRCITNQPPVAATAAVGRWEMQTRRRRLWTAEGRGRRRSS